MRMLDLNGNQRPDFYVAGVSDSALDTKIALLLDNGSGGFKAPAELTVPNLYPGLVTAGDFDGDGNVDFAVVGSPLPADVCCTVQVLRGTAGGGYGTPQAITFPGGHTVDYLTALTSRDLDGDGKADLILGGDFKSMGGATDTGIMFARGTASGFGNETLVSTNFDPADIHIADLNRDQKLDIVAISDANGVNNRIYSLLGNGNATFQGLRSFTLPLSEPSYFSIADINLDSNLDLVSCSTNNPGLIISMGDGLGGFMTGQTVTVPQNPSNVATADVQANSWLPPSAHSSLRGTGRV